MFYWHRPLSIGNAFLSFSINFTSRKLWKNNYFAADADTSPQGSVTSNAGVAWQRERGQSWTSIHVIKPYKNNTCTKLPKTKVCTHGVANVNVAEIEIQNRKSRFHPKVKDLKTKHTHLWSFSRTWWSLWFINVTLLTTRYWMRERDVRSYKHVHFITKLEIQPKTESKTSQTWKRSRHEIHNYGSRPGTFK